MEVMDEGRIFLEEDEEEVREFDGEERVKYHGYK